MAIVQGILSFLLMGHSVNSVIHQKQTMSWRVTPLWQLSRASFRFYSWGIVLTVHTPKTDNVMASHPSMAIFQCILSFLLMGRSVNSVIHQKQTMSQRASLLGQFFRACFRFYLWGIVLTVSHAKNRQCHSEPLFYGNFLGHPFVSTHGA